ncbi:MAG: nuclear transport factor 2 family protein, partial [Pseudomonadota bacterium]
MKKVLLSGLALAVLAVTTGHEAVPQATTEPIGLDDVLERLQVIEDRQAILDLQFRYSSYNDNGFKADRIADMFVEEGVWTGGVFGTYVGVEAIKGFFQSAPSFAKS